MCRGPSRTTLRFSWKGSNCPQKESATTGPRATCLPIDVWRVVADFVEAPALSHTCALLWAALRHRHLQYRVSPANPLGSLLALLAGGGHPAHTLRLAAPRSLSPAEAAAVAMALLCHCPALRALAVHAPLTDAALAGFSPLAAHPALTSLTLDCSRGAVGEAGLAAVAELAAASRLERLTLGLAHCPLRPAGCRPLRRLRDAPCLAVLVLDVRYTDLRDEGVEHIVAAGHGPSLTALALDCHCAGLTDAAARHLALLADRPHLRRLTLRLGADVVCGPEHCRATHPRPTPLRLNAITDAGAQSLAVLGRSPSLTALTLHLGLSGVGPPGAADLRSLAALPALRHFSLTLPRDPPPPGK